MAGIEVGILGVDAPGPGRPVAAVAAADVIEVAQIRLAPVDGEVGGGGIGEAGASAGAAEEVEGGRPARRVAAETRDPAQHLVDLVRDHPGEIVVPRGDAVAWSVVVVDAAHEA